MEDNKEELIVKEEKTTSLTTEQQAKYLKQYIAKQGWKRKGISDSEIDYFLQTCLIYKLNPLLKEVYGLPIASYGKVSLTVIVNYLKILEIGESDEDFAGYDYKTFVGDKETNQFGPTTPNVIYEVTIYHYNKWTHQREPFTVTKTDLSEYYKSTKATFKNNYFKSWCEKIALVNAFRRTYPNKVRGLYINEEFANQQVEEEPQPLTNQVRLLNVKQYQAIFDEYQLTNQQIQEIIKEFYKEHKQYTKESFLKGEIDPNELREYTIKEMETWKTTTNDILVENEKTK